jgi:hypothetical protein
MGYVIKVRGMGGRIALKGLVSSEGRRISGSIGVKETSVLSSLSWQTVSGD